MNAAAATLPKTSVANTLGAISVLGVLAITIVPLPASVLDVLLAAALCLAILTFLVAIYVEKSLDFSSFPSLLLLVTLFRLALNIATTRRILLHGNEGTEAAGSIIQAFGEFAVGGNFVVGAVVFLILVVINYVVITKGAERISEVAARFTLDSMPGKQMAIDADLGAGLIDEEAAKVRRKLIEQEADFHGAMDGASKFVRGDAVAGLIILGINIVGGMVVGVAQHDLPFGEAASNYTLLSIGDGLVSQIPALLVSTGAALLTTRSSAAGVLTSTVAAQLFKNPAPIRVAAAALGVAGLIPGTPHIALFALSGGLFYLAGSGATRARTQGRADAASAAAGKATPKPSDPATQKAEIEALLPVELLSLDVGLDLLPLVDVSKSGDLLTRIASLRKQLALELGFVVPPVHVQDDLRLRPGGYRLRLSGVQVAQGEVRAGRFLAVAPTEASVSRLHGEMVREPTFGLPAKWIAGSERAAAEAAGCTVVDPSAVIATHLTELVRRHAHELLGRKEAQDLLDLAAKTNAKLVEELTPNLLPLGEIIKVLRMLLQESVSIRDVRSILEAMADCASTTKVPSELAEFVRQRLSRQITRAHMSQDGRLEAKVLDPKLEDLFRSGGRGADAQALSRATAALESFAEDASARDESPVLVVAPDVRSAVAAIALRHVPGLSVMSYREIDPSVPFVSRGIVAVKENNA
ncbi:MAG: flagellar biosynthesis protein FlhA [Deltaproteobacteria bacterium]|nr:flagellar biosynthesis protein FlhA [Deltaproteobacteria bacterium]